mmetsp:Transcript_52528/g.151392  ORF Transcript_52528/g.151392 Transcript_52528/m.151392 type:complete len:169 (-) Transcript_52528:88-594(-)
MCSCLCKGKNRANTQQHLDWENDAHDSLDASGFGGIAAKTEEKDVIVDQREEAKLKDLSQIELEGDQLYREDDQKEDPAPLEEPPLQQGMSTYADGDGKEPAPGAATEAPETSSEASAEVKDAPAEVAAASTVRRGPFVVRHKEVEEVGPHFVCCLFYRRAVSIPSSN